MYEEQLAHVVFFINYPGIACQSDCRTCDCSTITSGCNPGIIYENIQVTVPAGSSGHFRLTHWKGGGGTLHFQKFSLNKQQKQYDI